MVHTCKYCLPVYITYTCTYYFRYDAENNELVSDTIGVAYPVKNGVPNLVPQDGRMLNSDNPIDTEVKPDSHKS